LISLYPLQKDKQLAKSFFIFDFIEPKHLEIPDGIFIESTLELAAECKNLDLIQLARDS
jgi:hypothetical protein